MFHCSVINVLMKMQSLFISDSFVRISNSKPCVNSFSEIRKIIFLLYKDLVIMSLIPCASRLFSYRNLRKGLA